MSTPTSIVRGNGESIDVRTVDNASKWFKPYPVSETCLSFLKAWFVRSIKVLKAGYDDDWLVGCCL